MHFPLTTWLGMGLAVWAGGFVFSAAGVALGYAAAPDTVQPITTPVVNTVRPIITPVVNTVRPIITPIVNTVQKVAAPIVDTVQPIITPIATIAASCASHPGTERRTMSTLDDWIETACAELGLDPAELPQKTVLNLARVLAHTVDRPAAPLTAYLLGVAVGRGLALPDAADRIRALAARWPESTEPAGGQEGA